MAAEVRFLKSNNISTQKMMLEIHARQAGLMFNMPRRVLVVTTKPMVASWQERLQQMPIVTRVVTPYSFQALTAEAMADNLILIDMLYPDQLQRVFEKVAADNFSYGVYQA
ncbi:hypothetical protein [Achromobacter phage Motura]|uniref:Uncharacterized protein n=1 Tax=Achromobacter phage Motura TaxID=2591403 RepID=A0A514CSQ7_9CAUD|nr:hypothetical protein H1O15_gp289 [Achromobacter phage Motura]QDH83517.1 hypothetical protein [Achromobacter phage Motura]